MPLYRNARFARALAGTGASSLPTEDLTVLLLAWIVCIFVALAGTWWPLLLVLTGTLVYADARACGIGKGTLPGFFDMSPLGWALATMLILVVALPAYALVRGQARTRPGNPLGLVFAVVVGGLLLAVSGLSVLASLATVGDSGQAASRGSRGITGGGIAVCSGVSASNPWGTCGVGRLCLTSGKCCSPMGVGYCRAKGISVEACDCLWDRHPEATDRSLGQEEIRQYCLLTCSAVEQACRYGSEASRATCTALETRCNEGCPAAAVGTAGAAPRKRQEEPGTGKPSASDCSFYRQMCQGHESEGEDDWAKICWHAYYNIHKCR